MKFTLKTFVLPSVAFCAAAAFAASPARVNVPFSFTAQGQSYPAGRYEVTTDVNHNFVTLANENDASKHISWIVGPADASNMPAVVTFDEAGTSHYLRTVQMGDKITPNLDIHSKAGISATTSIGGQ